MSEEGENVFAERFAEAIGERYSPAMRRSVQTVVLYEANRCLKDRYSALRPFQRKIALYDTAVDLINTLDIIPSHLRSEIMYRTASGKLPLSADLAWRRMRLIDREIAKTIIPKIKPFCEDNDKDHKTICAEFIQDQYVSNNDDDAFKIMTNRSTEKNKTRSFHSLTTLFLHFFIKQQNYITFFTL